MMLTTKIDTFPRFTKGMNQIQCFRYKKKSILIET